MVVSNILYVLSPKKMRDMIPCLTHFFRLHICPHVTSSETFAATAGTFLGSKVIGETPGLNVAATSGPNLRVSKQKVGEKNRIQ